MKLYALDSVETAQACRLLIRLNNDCASLQWSDTIRGIPSDVLDGMETVQGYAETKLNDFCAQGKLLRELTDEEETLWHSWSKISETLRRSMGSGVILAGKESRMAQEALENFPEASFIIEALREGENLVLI